MAITQTISTIPQAGHRGVDARDTFVTKQEAFQDALQSVTVGQLNTAFTQLNALEANVNAKEASAVAAELEATAQAGIATTKASEASLSAANALTSEQAAELAESNTATLLNQFENNVYVRSPNPPASTEAAWFDTTNNSLKIWNSVEWVSAGSSVNGMYQRNTYTALADQTIFDSVYDIDSVVVYKNGMMLTPSDFVATNGTQVVLAVPSIAGDIIDIVGFGAINAENIYNKTEVNDLIALKADQATTYTKTEVDTAIAAGSFTLAQAQATALLF